jgi:hypothetical protein
MNLNGRSQARKDINLNRCERSSLGRWLLERRGRDGALLSVRIAVTPANRRLLRAMRAEELKAWRLADASDRCA